MEKTNCLISCTDGYYGSGFYDETKKYILYNKEKWQNTIKHIYNRNGRGNLMEMDFLLYGRKNL